MKAFGITVGIFLGLGLLIIGAIFFANTAPYMNFEYLARNLEIGIGLGGIVLIVSFLFALVCLAVYLWSRATGNIVNQKSAGNPVNIYSGEQASARGSYYEDSRSINLRNISREELRLTVREILETERQLALSGQQFSALPNSSWSGNDNRNGVRCFK